MLDERKLIAIKLRLSGHSIKSIANELNAAQSSVSVWVKEIELSDQQKLKLKSNTHSPVTVEKRRKSRLASELNKRNNAINSAKTRIKNIDKRELWLIGTALYWAEGAKTQSTVLFSNGDPRMIILMMKYFREVCLVNELKMRCRIHIHEHLDTMKAEKYWLRITGLGKSQLYKTYNKPNKSSKGKRNSLPYGVCEIYVLDANLLLQIKGWTEGIYDSSLKMIQ